ncbi:PqqD family protein [Aquidulcibacter paucihalophilus]|uniref:PqqD family protein n=1 Tax=Aquidulcibacter paucihalophilus TaxID=1978549 RepID=UPI0012FF93DE|nr:PqqD family protein [Aquidulcibacter paucihalophilus]
MADSFEWMKSQNVVSCQMDGSEALLNTETGHYYLLNSVGALVWSELDNRKSFDKLVDLVTNAYEVSREECAKDLGALLGSMKSKGLVQASQVQG